MKQVGRKASRKRWHLSCVLKAEIFLAQRGEEDREGLGSVPLGTRSKTSDQAASRA